MDLSSLTVQKQWEPWYELHLDELRGLNPFNRESHIRSMVHSQKHDYRADVRLVLSERDDRHGGDPLLINSYTTPGVDVALKLVAEVVIRVADRPGEEYVAKSRSDADVGTWRRRSATGVAAAPSSAPTAAPAPPSRSALTAGRRPPLDLD